MSLDRLPELDPDPGEVLDAEVAVTDDVLVKAFALGPGAELDPHDHEGATNVFHVIRGTVTVRQGDDAERIEAPGVVLHERGVVHGARNDTDDVAVLTASLCPLPG
ncbi:MAG: cupin domain-containing protein [Halobacteriales archaeon]